jgi:superfamily I DNA and/or RNA helicase
MRALALESSGFALYDMFPSRRGNIFSDEVYRLVKGHDATSMYSIENQNEDDNSSDNHLKLPQNSKFCPNDVVMITLQMRGSGDFFGHSSTPTHKDAVTVEARVISTGPTYIDVVIPGGKFEATFGPAPNNNGPSGRGDKNMRLRVDRYFSNIPYNRMIAALGQISTIPTKPNVSLSESDTHSKKSKPTFNVVDGSIRQAILSTFSFDDPSSPYFQDIEACKLNDIARFIARPPLQDSTKLTNQVLSFLQKNTQNNFPNFNGPQLSAIGAALTRKLSLIHGPPGTGKTTVAAAIGFGFVHQCRSSTDLEKHSKVLATAFSNAGADNLAEALLRLGLKVVRVGKASAVSPSLWDYTLDAAIDKDPNAQKALEEASIATANLRRPKKDGRGVSKSKTDISIDRIKRDHATRAVEASIEVSFNMFVYVFMVISFLTLRKLQACNIAATKALREADVIVCTSIGAADSKLLAACGIILPDNNDADNTRIETEITLAPDGLPPLQFPFVITDEACQSVEPASLIPIFAFNSCKSVVMLGDPCQLPPTVISDTSGTGRSRLSVSLMSRLAANLPQPVIVTAMPDKSPRDENYLNLKVTKQSASLVKLKVQNEGGNVSYKKQYSGSILLSVQYRMHPSICAFASAVFYDSMLSTPTVVTDQRSIPFELNSLLTLQDGSGSVRFIDVQGGNNEHKESSTREMLMSQQEGSVFENSSISNEAEAVQLISFLKQLLKMREDSPAPFTGSIGVITPYTAQVVLLKSMIASDQEFRQLMMKNPLSIEVNSVDAYQGRERDIILFSAVRSNPKGNVGFLSDWRRMNVALTRAKSGLVVFGDSNTLVHDPHWEAFVKYCDGLECVFDVAPPSAFE